MARQNNNQNNNYNNQYYNQNGQYYNNQYYNNGQYYNNQYYNQNGQYYNNQYQQQYNQKTNKKEKKKPDKFILIGVAVLAFLIIGAIALFIVFNNNDSEPDNDDSVIVDTENRTVGNDTVGYVMIPSDWLKFQDTESVRGLQYSDKDGTYIITLDAMSTEQVDAKTYASNVAEQLKKKNVSQLTETSVNVAGYRSYQVYGYYDSMNIWLVVWCFETENGYTHYIGIEGPDSNSEYFSIPNTFKLSK